MPLTPSSSPSATRLDRWAPWLAGALLALHALVALWAAAGQSVTADEILHLTHGYFVDRYGDHRIQPENGILPQRLHGLAAILTDAPTPELAHNEYWRSSSNLVVCHQFFYETGHDHYPMLMLARAFNTLFSVGAGLIVFLWARRFGGAGAGLVATAVYAADPNLLAHAALATSDLAAVFLLLASASAFFWQLERPGAGRITASALVFGLACTAKYSAVLLIPVFIGLLLLHRWRATGRQPRHWVPAIVAAHLAGAFLLIWLAYGFRYSGFSPALPAAQGYTAPWADILPWIGAQGRVVAVLRDWQLLPEAFLYGYAWVIQSAAGRASFLAGEYGIRGWTAFFPLAFLWKTSGALLAGLALALVTGARRWARDRSQLAGDLAAAAPLLLFGLVYTVVSVTSHLNIGHRHILPLYPALFVAVGVWAATRTGWWRRVACSLLLAGQAAASLSVAPHFLAYFNVTAGGPANGYRLLVDSSLDWGQDLPTLRDWLRANNGGSAPAPVFLSYFGSGEPDYYGIRAKRLPFVNGFKFPQAWYEPAPGLYCISATMLQQVYSGFGGEWSEALEREYRDLQRLEPGFRDYFTNPAARPTLLQLAPAERWESGWRRFDKLRFARLCRELRTREPEATAGYSILIYRVGPDELARGLGLAPTAVSRP